MTIAELVPVVNSRLELHFSDNSYWCQFDQTDAAFKSAVDEEYRDAEVLSISAEEYSAGDAALIITAAVDSDKYYVYQKEKHNTKTGISSTELDGAYTVRFTTFSHEARTLNPDDLGYHADSGWTLKGDIHTDYYSWVNYFEATKGEDWVKGDFEQEVTASSERAYLDFIKHFQVQEWDYWDI